MYKFKYYDFITFINLSLALLICNGNMKIFRHINMVITLKATLAKMQFN